MTEFNAAERIVYGIGAQKAGTTWLYDQLRAHPEVHMCGRKEVHYWDSHFFPHLPYYREKSGGELSRIRTKSLAKNIALGRIGEWRRKHRQAQRYHAMFHEADPGHAAYQAYVMEGWKGETVAGEISPGYAMMEPEGFRAMDRLAPDARFVFIMRDPVARLWSAIKHYDARGILKTEDKTAMEAEVGRVLDDETDHSHLMTDYSRTIRHLEEAIPVDRIAYFFFETLFTDEEMMRLSAFLEIGPMNASFGEQINPGQKGRGQLSAPLFARAREALSPTYDAVRKRFGDRVPEVWAS